MYRFAIYGKGGIGKSTVTTALSCAFAEMGLRVLQVGCDPKSDSTKNLMEGKRIPTVLEQLKEKGESLKLEDIVFEGFGGVLCVEAGGPTPGIGCAGRGIISAFEKLAELIRPGDDSRVCVCDETGRLVFDSAGAASGETLPEEILCFSDGEPQHELTSGGVSYAMASARAEKAGWYVLILTPQSEFSAGAMSVSSAILTAAVAALILIAVVTAIASRVISQPVKELADAMDETQLRDLSYRVTVSGADEIARLGNSFNALMDKLERSLAGEYEAALQQQKAEIRALQAQMNPHFLYNVLQSMASMAAVRHMSDLASMATALGSTMRYTISGNEPLVSLREELSYVENYLTIQKLRFGERLHAEIDVPEYVMGCAVPRVSIQPLVENAILHGLEQREKPGTIRIGAWTAGDRLTIEVTDDGQGMTEEELAQLRSALYALSPAEERRGIGLRNLYMRLRLLYDETAQLTLDSEEGIGTVAQIVIPMERRCSL